MSDNEMLMGAIAVISLCLTAIFLTAIVVRGRNRRRIDSGDSDPAFQRLEARLERLEQGVEAIAIEVERVAEGQRFATKLLSERSGEQMRV